MPYYEWIKILHGLAAVVAAGPLLVAPWLSRQLSDCPPASQTLLLNGLARIDRYYNISGWLLMISGALMFWLDDWHRLFQLWFILCVAIFIVDSLFEKRWRDPATQALRQHNSDEQRIMHVRNLQWAVVGQMLCTILILIVMLLHSHLPGSFLSIIVFPRLF